MAKIYKIAPTFEVGEWVVFKAHKLSEPSDPNIEVSGFVDPFLVYSITYSIDGVVSYVIKSGTLTEVVSEHEIELYEPLDNKNK